MSQGFNLRISPPVACQLPNVLALTRLGLSQLAINGLLGTHAGSKETVLVLHQQVNEAVEPSPCILSLI
ncbi:hypothetical protein [Peribacillus sp. NPDC096540]|uniref:hypothetical protein n=1 Tax=Peribacillus sp. NPDC096540 TaxID=3390612 RepID=UPI003D05219C